MFGSRFPLCLSLLLIALSGGPSSLADETELKGAGGARSSLSLSREACTSFDLTREGSLKSVPFMEQYYSNCYAAGASGQISAWIVSGGSSASRPFGPGPLPGYPASLGPLERQDLVTSPQHLSVSYALFRKSQEFSDPRLKDWNHRKGPSRSDRDRFRAAISKPALSEPEMKELRSLVFDRFFYFEKHGGFSSGVISNFVDHPVCPHATIEGRLGSQKRGLDFFRGVRLAYLALFQEGMALGSFSSRSLDRVRQKLEEAYDQAGVPREARLTPSEVREAIFPSGAVGETDPLHWLNEVLMGMCRRSDSLPPLTFRKALSHLPIGRIRLPESIRRPVTGPEHARDFIQAHFFGNPRRPRPQDQQPLGISYAASAIWNGPSELAWRYEGTQGKYVNDGRYGGHFSLIAGRRWNPQTATCEYLVRNSMHPHRYYAGWTPTLDQTGFWIRDDYLFRSINDIRYLSEF